jgi:hypothetical protein
MSANAVDGFAMKKLLIGSEYPGALPLDHVVPDEFICTVGTNTL